MCVFHNVKLRACARDRAARELAPCRKLHAERDFSDFADAT